MYIRLEEVQSEKIENVNVYSSVAYFTGYYILACIITFSGVSKIYNPFSLLESMQISLPLPTTVLIAIVSFIIVLETLIGLSLILRIKVKQNLIIAAFAFFIILLFSIYCSAIDVPVDSGLFGGIISAEFEASTIIKYIFILTATALLAVKETEFPD